MFVWALVMYSHHYSYRSCAVCEVQVHMHVSEMSECLSWQPGFQVSNG